MEDSHKIIREYIYDTERNIENLYHSKTGMIVNVKVEVIHLQKESGKRQAFIVVNVSNNE